MHGMLCSALLWHEQSDYHKHPSVKTEICKKNSYVSSAVLSINFPQLPGSAFQSKSQYLFGSIEMLIKLVPGNSAGTVTAYYVSTIEHFLIRYSKLIKYSPQVNKSHALIFNFAVIFAWKLAWRDWLWVLRQSLRTALYCPHEYLHSRKREQRAAIPFMVWSDSWFPQLHHPLEPIWSCVHLTNNPCTNFLPCLSKEW